MKRQRGYTYFGVLFIVALISLALSGAAAVWQIVQQREKERELLFIGQQYIDAIASYYHAAPGGAKQYPRTIAELLRDPRYLTVRRHLRKPWLDPMTGSREWGLVLTKQGRVAGIYSFAKGTPIKQSGFGQLDSLLANKSNYQEWKFIYLAARDESPRTESHQQDNESESNGESPDVETAGDESVMEEDTVELQ